MSSSLCVSYLDGALASFLALLDNTPGYVLNFEPHTLTYKISIEVGRSVGRSVSWSFSVHVRIQPMIIRLTLKHSAIK